MLHNTFRIDIFLNEVLCSLCHKCRPTSSDLRKRWAPSSVRMSSLRFSIAVLEKPHQRCSIFPPQPASLLWGGERNVAYYAVGDEHPHVVCFPFKCSFSLPYELSFGLICFLVGLFVFFSHILISSQKAMGLRAQLSDSQGCKQRQHRAFCCCLLLNGL